MSDSWTENTYRIVPFTLCVIVDEDKILLGEKKRGFGQGYVNGFGGKVEQGEDVVGAARREVLEEAGVKLDTIEEKGTLWFSFTDKPGVKMKVTVFLGKRVVGIPNESDEMRPVWFEASGIPYHRMWPADSVWLPKLLEGHRFEGSFHMDESHKVIKSEFTICNR